MNMATCPRHRANMCWPGYATTILSNTKPKVDRRVAGCRYRTKWVQLSTNSVHRISQTATHASLTEDQDESKVSGQAILDAVAAVRTGTPLTR